MVEPCICDNLNQMYRFFFFVFNKKTLKFIWKIVWKAIYWFLLHIYDSIFLVSKSSALFWNYVVIIWRITRGGGDWKTNFDFSFLIIYVIVPLHRRKFCDGRIILVSKWLSVSVGLSEYYTNIVAVLAKKLMDAIAWNFI